METIPAHRAVCEPFDPEDAYLLWCEKNPVTEDPMEGVTVECPVCGSDVGVVCTDDLDEFWTQGEDHDEWCPLRVESIFHAPSWESLDELLDAHSGKKTSAKYRSATADAAAELEAVREEIALARRELAAARSAAELDALREEIALAHKELAAARRRALLAERDAQRAEERAAALGIAIGQAAPAAALA